VSVTECLGPVLILSGGEDEHQHERAIVRSRVVLQFLRILCGSDNDCAIDELFMPMVYFGPDVCLHRIGCALNFSQFGTDYKQTQALTAPTPSSS
jgi:hypothetical protein